MPGAARERDTTGIRRSASSKPRKPTTATGSQARRDRAVRVRAVSRDHRAGGEPAAEHDGRTSGEQRRTPPTQAGPHRAAVQHDAGRGWDCDDPGDGDRPQKARRVVHDNLLQRSVGYLQDTMLAIVSVNSYHGEVTRNVRTYDHFCLTARALEAVGDRWSLLVIRDLLTGAKRFTDLMDRLGGITPKTLSQRLRELRRHRDRHRRPGAGQAGSLVSTDARRRRPLSTGQRWARHAWRRAGRAGPSADSAVCHRSPPALP